MNPYESQQLLDQYLLFHFGTADEVLPYAGGPRDALDFAVRTVTENLDTGIPVGRALDVGCAVGRSSFELSKFVDEVIGIDYSSAFVEAARQLAAGESLEYGRHEEGEAYTTLSARIPDGSRPDRVRFEGGDAGDLRADLGAFDIVHAANLLCRLPEPRRFLQSLPDLVVQGGSLVITTPCTWLAEFTAPQNWPPGSTIDWLDGILGATFERVALHDMPFLIREHARKFQWSVAQASVWRRR